MNGLFRDRFHLAIMGILAIGVELALIFAMLVFPEIRKEIAVAFIGELGIIVGFFFGQRATRRPGGG
jgi:putative flippase GtrA